MSISKYISLVYKNLIISLFKIIYKTPTKLVKSNNYDVVKFLKKKGKSQTSYFYKIFKEKNVSIFTDDLYNCSVIKNNSILYNISNQQHPKGFYRSKYKNTILKNGTPKFRKYFNGPVLILAQGRSGTNYFHWFFDILPKIYIVKKKYDLNYFSFFYLPELKFDFQIKTLKILGIPNSKILDSKKYRHIFTNKIVIPEHPYYKTGRWWNSFNKIPSWIIKINKLNFGQSKHKIFQKKKIFIDRSDSKSFHNQIYNIDELRKLLVSKGFEVVRLAEEKFSNQINIFKSAKIIVGPHGAGFTNIIFCKKGTKIIDIKQKSFKKNFLYKNLSKICGLIYVSLNIKKMHNNKILINLKKFKKNY